MVENVRDFLRKDRRKNIQTSYECPTSCGDDGNCAVGFVCVDGRCVNADSGSTSSECPSSPVGGSGCSGCDPACENGITYVDDNGDKQCREGTTCGPNNPCPSGSTCQNGNCVPVQCNNGGGCDSGLHCCAGICKETCTGEEGQPCGGNFDCVGNNVCIGNICTDNPNKPEVDYPTDGKPCDPACDTFFKEFGYNSLSCNPNLRCGTCQECWNRECRPLNPSSSFTPCACKEAPPCMSCRNGEFVKDCGCSDCSSVSNVNCPCGIIVRGPISACKGACEDGLVSGSLLRQQVSRICQKVCGNTNPIDQCKGSCRTTALPCTGFSCPSGSNCTLTGRIEANGQATCIYEICDPSQRPDYCNDEQDLKITISVSVIDEDSDYSPGQKNADWAAYRASYPDRPFYVLAPGGYVAPPAGWNGGTYSVARMPGVSNWFSLLSGPLANASSVLLWIDNSGSMTTGTVSGSLSLFRTNCAAAGIRVCTKSGGSENWIGPHIGGGWCY